MRIPGAERLERWIFFVATAVIALRVADDNFLQPEAGTAAGDHLLSGLVPLGLLAVAAAAYPGRRPGARAVIAGLVGLFGIAAGLEGWHYLTTASARGDDFTSLLSLPAGLVLLGLAGVTLWQSRRTDDARARRYTRRALTALAAVIGGFVLVLPFLIAYGTTHLARGIVPEAALGADYEEVKFTTEDGLDLKGWYVASQNGAAVISFPGREGAQDPARLLAEHGFGVLALRPSRRGLRATASRTHGAGAAIATSTPRSGSCARGASTRGRIGGIGQSVGGEIMLEAAARSEGLKAVVSEGAGLRSAREAGERDPRRSARGPRNGPADSEAWRLFSNESVPPDLVDLIGRIAPRPVLLIYAADGQGGEELNEEYFEAAGEPKEYGRPRRAGAGGQAAAPEEFERRVVGFFDAALLDVTYVTRRVARMRQSCHSWRPSTSTC